ncbi:MAG: DNA (cytosine-5-)-methyltransferase [Bacteroidaceae bacterium]|nr:DNA (cytosine-5-)-methyltransferase [Bacteroidaceae bacterium]
MPYRHQALFELALKIEALRGKDKAPRLAGFAFDHSPLSQAACLTHYLQTADHPHAAVLKSVAESTQAEWGEMLKTPALTQWMARKGYDATLLSPNLEQFPFAPPSSARFSFIDLFAGMGGFRLAMQQWGGRCLFSSEWNAYAQRTYFANFGEIPFGDITSAEVRSFIPEEFDILCAGFPCQPFSIAGVSKKKSLGRATGFADQTQGTLFFEVATIIQKHRPKAFFLENVKNLTSHDKGRTFQVICDTLHQLDYSIHFQVMDGKNYVPQHRERIMIVGFDKRRYRGEELFAFPSPPDSQPCIADILQNDPDEKYTLTDKLWQFLQDYAQKHKAKGNGFGYGMTPLDGIARTLSARYYKDGSEILIPHPQGGNPRRLTPRECARLMGYPDHYRLGAVSDVQAYRQCGNSVVVPLITAVAQQVVHTMFHPNPASNDNDV